MNKTTNHKGFTLLELTIYAGLLGIFLLFISKAFISILSVKLETESTSPLYEDANYIIGRLTYDIHRASRIISPLVGQSGSSLMLGIIEQGNEHIYRYALENDTLTLSDGATTDRLHAESIDVNQFTVTRIGNSATNPLAKDTLQIQLSLLSTIQQSSGSKTITLESTIGLR